VVMPMSRSWSAVLICEVSVSQHTITYLADLRRLHLSRRLRDVKVAPQCPLWCELWYAKCITHRRRERDESEVERPQGEREITTKDEDCEGYCASADGLGLKAYEAAGPGM
jgi:hypothetical protein